MNFEFIRYPDEFGIIIIICDLLSMGVLAPNAHHAQVHSSGGWKNKVGGLRKCGVYFKNHPTELHKQHGFESHYDNEL